MSQVSCGSFALISLSSFFLPAVSGFKHKELRGKLAIGITANFVNRNTAAEAQVAEISGVARIYNQKFFQDLLTETGRNHEGLCTKFGFIGAAQFLYVK